MLRPDRLAYTRSCSYACALAHVARMRFAHRFAPTARTQAREINSSSEQAVTVKGELLFRPSVHMCAYLYFRSPTRTPEVHSDMQSAKPELKRSLKAALAEVVKSKAEAKVAPDCCS